MDSAQDYRDFREARPVFQGGRGYFAGTTTN
jgi:hypothetical protein